MRPSDDLISLIATAALDVGRWADVAAAVAADGRVPVQFYQSLRSQRDGGFEYEVHDRGTVDSAVLNTLPDYGGLDITSPALARGVAAQGSARPAFLHDWLDDADYRSSPFCQEYLRAMGAGEAGTMLLGGTTTAPTVLTFMTPFGERFDDRMRERLTAVTHYLRQAALHYQRAWSAGVPATGMTDVLSARTTPAILLDRSGRLLVANAGAEALLRVGPLNVRQGRLVCGQPVQKRALDAAVARTIGPDCALAEAVIGPPEQRLLVQLAPVGGRTPFVDKQGPAAAVAHLILPTVPGPAETLTRRIMMMHGLTPAEAAVATALANGATLLEIAEVRGVSLHTVRDQVKAAQSRTGARTQGDLIRIINRLG